MADQKGPVKLLKDVERKYCRISIRFRGGCVGVERRSRRVHEGVGSGGMRSIAVGDAVGGSTNAALVE